MNIVASFFGLGAPELMFLLGAMVVVALIFLAVKGFIKGYTSNKKS